MGETASCPLVPASFFSSKSYGWLCCGMCLEGTYATLTSLTSKEIFVSRCPLFPLQQIGILLLSYLYLRGNQCYTTRWAHCLHAPFRFLCASLLCYHALGEIIQPNKSQQMCIKPLPHAKLCTKGTRMTRHRDTASGLRGAYSLVGNKGRLLSVQVYVHGYFLLRGSKILAMIFWNSSDNLGKAF